MNVPMPKLPGRQPARRRQSGGSVAMRAVLVGAAVVAIVTGAMAAGALLERFSPSRSATTATTAAEPTITDRPSTTARPATKRAAIAPAGGVESAEYKLAAVALGRPPSDAEVRTYAMALDAAEPVCREGRDGIGDVVHAGTVTAANVDVTVTHLELLRAIPATVSTEMRPTPCGDIVAGIIVLMVE